MLIPFAPELWVVSAPCSMLGLQLGTRMTVVRLPDGGVLLHSPVPIDDALASAIDALGPVAHVVAPNRYHHLFVGPALARWPASRLYAAPGLERKRRDLKIDARFEEDAALPFASALEPITIRGCLLGETVLYHRATRTLISSDLVENFSSADHLPTRLYLKAAGVYRRVGWSRFLRPLYRDRPLARRAIDRILALDLDRVILAHGDPIVHAPRSALADGLRFLGEGTGVPS